MKILLGLILISVLTGCSIPTIQPGSVEITPVLKKSPKENFKHSLFLVRTKDWFFDNEVKSGFFSELNEKFQACNMKLTVVDVDRDASGIHKNTTNKIKDSDIDLFLYMKDVGGDLNVTDYKTIGKLNFNIEARLAKSLLSREKMRKNGPIWKASLTYVFRNDSLTDRVSGGKVLADRLFNQLIGDNVLLGCS